MNQFRSVALLLLVFGMAPASATEPFNSAALWHSWDNVARDAYIEGVVDGIAEAFITTMTTVAPKKLRNDPTPPEVKKVTDKLFVRHTRNQIQDVMTDIYKDPANSFISTLDVFFLARDKIEGRDIGKDTMEARKKAMERHELNEKMRNK